MTERKSTLNVLSSMRLLLVATLAVFTLGLVCINAQDGDGNVVRVTTELASFEVSVTDKNGQPVTLFINYEDFMSGKNVQRNNPDLMPGDSVVVSGG